MCDDQARQRIPRNILREFVGNSGLLTREVRPPTAAETLRNMAEQLLKEAAFQREQAAQLTKQADETECLASEYNAAALKLQEG